MQKQKHYIIYKITNVTNDKIYIGCHLTHNLDDDYLGSGTEIRKEIKKLGKKFFKKEILFIYDNRKEMLAKERELVTREFCHSLNTYNLIIGGGGYSVEGRVCVKDKDGNVFQIYCDDPRYLSGELVHCLKGQSQHPNSNNTGLRKSEKSKKKQSQSRMGKYSGKNNATFGTKWNWLTNGIEIKKVSEHDTEQWINKGWCIGNVLLAKEQVLNSGVDFNKHGWVKQLSEKLEFSAPTIRTFVKINMPIVWDNSYKKCQIQKL